MALSSCQKSEDPLEPIIDENQSVWKEDSTFFGRDKILLTSYPINDSILMVANNEQAYYLNTVTNTRLTGAYLTLNYTYQIAPSLTSRYGIHYTNEKLIRFFDVTEPATVVQSNGFRYQPQYSNSTSSAKEFPKPGAIHPNPYSIIGSQALIPIEIDYVENKAFVNLMRISPSFGVHLDGKVEKQLELHPDSTALGFSGALFFSYTFFGKYFMHYGNQFYRIDTLGNVKSFGHSPDKNRQPVYSLFQLGSSLFALSNDAILISQDQGENWGLYTDQFERNLLLLKYHQVGEELYATFMSQIFKLTLSGNTLEIVELDNRGLETKGITSLSKSGGKYYVTTYSGLYYKDADAFNQTKAN